MSWIPAKDLAGEGEEVEEVCVEDCSALLGVAAQLYQDVTVVVPVRSRQHDLRRNRLHPEGVNQFHRDQG